MMKLKIPVTVENVACVLFHEVYNKAIKGLYHIKYDCFEESSNNYSAYIWAKSSTCDQPNEIDCLVGTLYRTNTPCDRTPTSLTCDITTTTTVGTTSCSMIDITVNIL